MNSRLSRSYFDLVKKKKSQTVLKYRNKYFKCYLNVPLVLKEEINKTKFLKKIKIILIEQIVI